MATLAVLLSLGGAIAFRLEAPSPRLEPVLLRLRGGVDMSTIATAGAGLMGASGAFNYISPKGKFALYGVPEPDALALAGLRNVGAWQIMIAVMLKLNTKDVHAASLLLAAAAVFLSVPQTELFGAPKAAAVVWIGGLAIAGKLALDGKGPTSPWVSTVVYLLNGVHCHFFPKQVAELYQVSEPLSSLAYSMVSLQGSMMLMAAVYLGCLAYGASQPLAFAAAFFTRGAFPLKWLLTTMPAGVPSSGPISWALASAVLVGLALTKV